MKTSLGYPIAIIRHGTGFKFAWLESFSWDNARVKGFYGYACKTAWREFYKTNTKPEYYKTKRLILTKDVVGRWRNYPSKKTTQLAIKRYNRIKRS